MGKFCPECQFDPVKVNLVETFCIFPVSIPMFVYDQTIGANLL